MREIDMKEISLPIIDRWRISFVQFGVRHSRFIEKPAVAGFSISFYHYINSNFIIS